MMMAELFNGNRFADRKIKQIDERSWGFQNRKGSISF